MHHTIATDYTVNKLLQIVMHKMLLFIVSMHESGDRKEQNLVDFNIAAPLFIALITSTLSFTVQSHRSAW